jgi:hypothetical protein
MIRYLSSIPVWNIDPNGEFNKIGIDLKKNSERDGPENTPPTPCGSKAMVVFQFNTI